MANFVCPGLLGDLSAFRKGMYVLHFLSIYIMCFHCSRNSLLQSAVYERPISAANSKSATFEQRACGHAQSQALDEITKLFMLRRLQKDILKSLLPPRKEFLLFCRPSETQRELYKSISSKAMSSTQSGATADALTVLTSLRKLCSHPSLLEKSGQVETTLSGKVEILDALLQAIQKHNPNDKIVIVSNFTSALTVIEDTILKARGLPYLRLDGSVAQSERQPLVDSFNRCSPDKTFAFLLSSKAGGCGLNLIGGKFYCYIERVNSMFRHYDVDHYMLSLLFVANRLVMFDADFNPATDMQAMARIYRQGQTKPCFIYRTFTSGTVEEGKLQDVSKSLSLLLLLSSHSLVCHQQQSSISARFRKATWPRLQSTDHRLPSRRRLALPRKSFATALHSRKNVRVIPNAKSASTGPSTVSAFCQC